MLRIARGKSEDDDEDIVDQSEELSVSVLS